MHVSFSDGDSRQAQALYLVGKHQKCIVGEEEGLVAEKEAGIFAVSTAVAVHIRAGVQEGVMHGGVVVRRAAPFTVPHCPALRWLPAQVSAPVATRFSLSERKERRGGGRGENDRELCQHR